MRKHQTIGALLRAGIPRAANREEAARAVAPALSALAAGDYTSDELQEFVAHLCNEGSAVGQVSNWTPMKVELMHSLASIDDMASTSDERDLIATYFLRWSSQPIGDLLARSTSGSYGGKAVRSAEGAEPLEMLQTVVLCHLLDEQLISITPVSRAGGPVAATGPDFSVDGSHIVDMNHAGRLAKWARMCDAARANLRNLHGDTADNTTGALPQAAADAAWERGRANAAAGNDTMSAAESLALVETPDAHLAYTMLTEDASLYLSCLYPRAHTNLKLAGVAFDVTQMIEVAAQRIEEMIARRADPAAVVTYALYDALDFRRKGVALVMELSGEVVASFSEHAAIKVQRLGSRPLSIQTPLARLVQDLHQNYPRLDHPGAITGVRGAESRTRLANLAACMAKPSLPGASNPSADDIRAGTQQPPATSPCTFLDEGSAERAVAAAWEVSMAPLLTAATYHTSIELTQQDINWREAMAACQEAADAELETAGEASEPTTVGPCTYTLTALQIASSLRATGTTFHALKRVCAGTTPIGARLHNEGCPTNAEVAVNESDSKAFTLAAPIAMTTMHCYGKRFRPTGSNRAASACNLLYFLATRRSIYMVDDAMGDGGNLHGPECRCYDKQLLGNMFPPWFRKYTKIPDTFTWGPSCGAVSQGMDAPATTYYVFMGLCGVWRPHYAGVNGDDGAGGMRVPALPRDWAMRVKRNGSDPLTFGTEATRSASTKAMLCHANLMELLWGRSYGAASAGLIPSAKKCSTGLATGPNPATTLVYRILPVGTREALETRGPNVAMMIGPQLQRSLPALISQAWRNAYAAASAESDPTAMARAVVTKCSEIAPNLGAILSKVRHTAVISIWSGSGTILDGTPAAAKLATQEVMMDPEAPDWAKRLARQGLLVLPKGASVGIQYRERDWLAAGCLQANSPSALRMLQYRTAGRTCSFAEWVARGYGLAKPLLDEADYAGESAIDLRQYRTDGPTTIAYLHTGDAGPGLPMHTLQALINKPYTGGSRYSAAARSELRGAVVSTTYAGNGMVRTEYSPLWAAASPQLNDETHPAAQATVIITGSQYGQPATLRALVRVAPQDAGSAFGRQAFSADCAGTTIVGFLQRERNMRLGCGYFAKSVHTDVSPADLAAAVVRYAAPRMLMVPGSATELSIEPRNEPNGVLLGPGELPLRNHVMQPHGIPTSGPIGQQLNVAVTLKAPTYAAGDLSRTTVAQRLKLRRSGHPATIISAAAWYDAPATKRTSREAAVEVTTDDALQEANCGPTPAEVICGGQLQLRANCTDIAAACWVPAEDREELMYALHSSVRKNDTAIAVVTTADAVYKCTASELRREGRSSPPTKHPCTGPAGLYSGLSLAVLMHLCM